MAERAWKLIGGEGICPPSRRRGSGARIQGRGDIEDSDPFYLPYHRKCYRHLLTFSCQRCKKLLCTMVSQHQLIVCLSPNEL